MDTASKMALARKAKELEKEKRKNAVAARTRGQMLQRMAAKSAPSSPCPKKQDVPLKVPPPDKYAATKREVLENMASNLHVAPSRRRYCTTVLRMAMTLATSSLPCYLLLRKFMVLPSYVTVFNHFQPELQTQTSFFDTCK